MPDWRMIPARQYGLIVCKQKTYSMFSGAVRGWAVVLYSIASIAPHAPNYKSQAPGLVTVRKPRVENLIVVGRYVLARPGGV